MNVGDKIVTTHSSGANKPLSVHEITSVEEFVSISDEWEILVRSSKRPSLFLTHAWLTNWLMCHQSDDRELLVLLAYEDGKLIGAAPLMKSIGRLLGIPVKRIEFLTMMPVAASPSNCSGELDFIITGRGEEVIERFLIHLREHHRWDYLRLYPIPEGSPTEAVLERLASRSGAIVQKKEAFMNACLHMEQGWETFAGTVSKQFRRTIRQHEQKLEKLGTIRCVEYRTPFELEVMYHDILEIEKASWKWGKGVAINSVAFRDFYKRFALRAAELGWMRLWMIELDGKNIAYDYCVEYDGRVQSLKKSYRTEYRQYFPGGILEAHCFAAMAGEGVREVNLLWGDEEYKKKWSPVMEPHVEFTMFNSTPYARFVESTFFKSDVVELGEKAELLLKRGLRFVGVRSGWSELTREDQLHAHGTNAPALPQNTLKPGVLVRVKSVRDILLTLDDAGSLKNVSCMPEMLKLSGKVFRVSHLVPVRDTADVSHEGPQGAVVLHGACCNGEAHEECSKACLFLWREEWLESVIDATGKGDQPPGTVQEGRPGESEIAHCQDGPETAFGKSRFVGLPRLLRHVRGQGEGFEGKEVQQE
jgi:CelD/BcsL family acetyltransferase involved in cellulose biosynthesis